MVINYCLCLLERWRRARLLSCTHPVSRIYCFSTAWYLISHFWKEWVLFNCTWYLFSIAQLLYLQDQELQTWLFKCYMCTSGVLSWHFLLFSFPFVHSYAFRVSHYEFQTFQFHQDINIDWLHRATSEKLTVGLKTCRGHCRLGTGP